jgi:Fe-S cluster biosynthesis and repair protein YggX
MTKTLNQIIFFFLHQNQNIFFINIGNQNIFLAQSYLKEQMEKFFFSADGADDIAGYTKE